MKSIIIKSITFAVILILLVSCGKNRTAKGFNINISDMKTININSQKGDFLITDSLFSKVDFVKLETTDNSLIGRISQILFPDSLILIVDKNSAKGMYLFNRDGSFYKQAGNIGNGPGEYVSLDYVTLMLQEKLISALDLSQQKIIKYKYNGEFHSEKKMPFTFLYNEYMNTGENVYYTLGYSTGYPNHEDKTLFVMDPSDNPLFNGFENIYDERHFNYIFNSPMRKFDSEIYYVPNFNNTIFQIKRDSAIAKYYINIEHNGMPSVNKNTTDEQFVDYTNKYFYFNGDFIELKSFTFIKIATPTSYPFVIFSHNTNRTYFNSRLANNPLYLFSEYPNAIPKNRYKENAVVIDIPAYVIVSEKEAFYNVIQPKDKKMLDDLYNGLTEDDNPVLFFYYINKNI